MERVLTPLDIDTMDQLVASHAVEQDGHSKAPSESDDVNTISAITQWIFDGDGHQWIPVESVTVDHIEEVTVMTRDEHGYSGDEYQLPVFGRFRFATEENQG